MKKFGKVTSLIVCAIMLEGMNPCKTISAEGNASYTSNVEITSANENPKESNQSKLSVYEYSYFNEKGNSNELEPYSDYLESLQIPEDILQTISTEDLLDEILDYPRLCHIVEYEDLNVAFYHLRREFNGIEEFFNRDDAYVILVNKYTQFTIPKERTVKYPINDGSQESIDIFNAMLRDESIKKDIRKDGKISNSINIMEIMMLNLSDGNIKLEKTKSYIALKNSQKAESEFFQNGKSTFVSEYLGLGVSVLSTYPDNTSLRFFTPKGVYYRANYLNSTEPNTYGEYAELISDYHAELVELGTKSYNCHSYTFLKDINTMYKNLWLDNTNPFFEGGYLMKVSKENVRPGDIVYTKSHSGIVVEPKKNNPNNHYNPDMYVINKIGGGGPIVKLYLSDNSALESPFSYEPSFYRTK